MKNCEYDTGDQCDFFNNKEILLRCKGNPHNCPSAALAWAYSNPRVAKYVREEADRRIREMEKESKEQS